MLHIKKLNIKPELLGDGDCLTSIIYKIFEYHKKDNYEIIFGGQGKLEYTPAEDVFTPFNTNTLLETPSRNYMKELLTYANINFVRINTNSDIKCLIDKGQPVMYLGSAYIMPWRKKYGAEQNNKHGCLIIGYDDFVNSYICIDPVFEHDILYLPYENIIDPPMNPLVGFFDFDLINQEAIYDLSNLLSYFKSEKYEAEYSYDALAKLARDIYKKNEIGRLFVENYYNYLFDSDTSFFITARAANVHNFFKYLHRTYKYSWLNEISELFAKELVLLRTTCGLILKYSRTGRQNLIILIINKILECSQIEKEAVDLILQYCPR